MAERARRSVGATLAATRAAWREGVAGNLAGGTHHSYADKGSGFCVFNDVALAARQAQADHLNDGSGWPLQVAVIDLDVHQGNGTAHIFQGDDSVFTLSLHGARNFPFRKEPSDLDVELPDGCADDDYLHALVDQVGVHRRVKPAVVHDGVHVAIHIVVGPACGDGAEHAVGAARLRSRADRCGRSDGRGAGGRGHGRTFCQRWWYCQATRQVVSCACSVSSRSLP